MKVSLSEMPVVDLAQLNGVTLTADVSKSLKSDHDLHRFVCRKDQCRAIG